MDSPLTWLWMQVSAVYTIRHTHADPTPRFRVSLLNGTLPPHGTVDCTIAYAPLMPGEAVTETIGIHVAGGNTVLIGCAGRATAPKVGRMQWDVAWDE